MVSVAYTPREVTGKPSTDRVKKLHDQILSAHEYIDTQRLKLYTDYMRLHWAEPLYARRGGAFKYVLSNLTPAIMDGELIVGRMSPYMRGTQLYPEYETAWMRESLKGTKRPEETYAKGLVPAEREKAPLSIYQVKPEEIPEIVKAIEFYQEDWRTVGERILKEREDYELVEKWQQELVFYRLWWDVPEGRTIVKYGDVIEEGLQATIDRCQKKIAELKSIETKEKIDKYDFYRGTILALEGAIALAENYAREAERLSGSADAKRREELIEIARICRKVPRYRADTFREAVQSFWFTHLAVWLEQNARGISPGRFDQYMYRPFKDDIESGRITEAEALELLELLRIKHYEIVRAHSKFTETAMTAQSTYQHVTLGGVDKYGRGADNELSKLVLQAGINLKTPQPTLSVRWCDELSHDFKLKVVEAIKAGSGYPALFGDKVGIKRFTKVTGASIEDARDWAPCACINMQLPGKRAPQWVMSHLNMPKLLELVLNDGINPLTGSRLVEDTGIKNIEGASFEEIEAAFIKLMALVLKKIAEYWNTCMVIKNKMGLVLPFTSALLDDCIEKGLHCQEGGCRYNESAYLMTCGMVNVANSLAAMKRCIFEKKLFTMEELKEALKHNFEGCEQIRRHLLNAPKFGNGDDYVDDITVELYEAYAKNTETNLNWLGQPWRAGALSVVTEIAYGNACGATPDGRKAGEQVCDGSVSPYPGTDTHGPTAVMKSAARLEGWRMDSHLLNMKFHPSAIEGPVGSEKFIALNDAYFDLGPYHVQYNIVDAKMLCDAQAHPQNYQDLMIRVAGFTVRWVDIGQALQNAVIRRTEQRQL